MITDYRSRKREDRLQATEVSVWSCQEHHELQEKKKLSLQMYKKYLNVSF